MNILLLNAAFNRYGGVKGHGGSQVPLNLCYLAAAAREARREDEVRILDAEIEGLSHEQTVVQAAQIAPDVIGITTNTCVFDSVIRLTEMLKQRLPNALVVLGGPHPSALPEGTLLDSRADFVVLGEGEATFNELLAELARGGEDWQAIKGLAWREGDEVHVNQTRPLIEELDSLPFPARDLVPNDLYRPPPSKNVDAGPSTLIASSRGCPFNCGFCAARSVWGRNIRARSAENLVAEMAECVERFHVRSFNFADEFFTAWKDRVLEICDLICRRKLPVTWVCSARAQKLDRETLEAMRRAGCREISFGIESGNDEMLRRMDKRIDLGEVRRVVALCRKVGLSTHAGFVLGYPGETKQSVADTIRFAKSLKLDIAAFFIASPLPGSRLYIEAIENRWLREDAHWADYSPLSNNEPVLRCPGLGPERLRQLRRKALRSFYVRPAYAIRRLLAVRHWYQVKDLLRGLAILLRIK